MSKTKEDVIKMCNKNTFVRLELFKMSLPSNTDLLIVLHLDLQNAMEGSELIFGSSHNNFH